MPRVRALVGGVLAASTVLLAVAAPVPAQDTLRVTGETPENTRILARVAALLNGGKAMEQAGRPDSALSLYHAGLAAARRADRTSKGTGLFEASLLEVIGDLHRSGARWGPAAAYYDSATVRLESMRRGLGVQEKLTLASFRAPLYDRWILTLLAGAPGRSPEEDALAALAVSDRGRSRDLRDMRASHALTGRARGLVLSYSAGMDLVANGRSLVARLDTMGLPALYYHATNDTLLVWIVRAGRVSLRRHAVDRDTLAAVVARLHEALRAPPGDGSPDWRTPAGRLSRTLLPLDVARISPGELLVVPDGPLATVPFAALPHRPDAVLGDRYAVRYMQGLGNLTQVATRAFDRAEAASRALVVGNPAMPPVRLEGGRAFEPLPFAEAEALEVADRFGAEAWTGAAATEARVLAELGNASVVHLATHGEAFESEARTDDSYLVLAAGGGEDGILTIGDILERAPPLRAELVVLSACRTAAGNVRTAEGTMGFHRAFFARGAQKVIASLWNVRDRATMELMDAFYEAWLGEGVPAAEALRRAQARVRALPGRSHPHYWAAFQLFQGRSSA